MTQQEPERDVPTLRFPITVPDIYADGVSLEASPYTVTVHFGISAGPSALRPTATVRMSHSHAKMFAIMLRKFLKNVEETWDAPIPLHANLLEEKNIDLDKDW